MSDRATSHGPTSDGRAAAEELPPVQPQLYQALCGIALGVLFFIQVEQGLLLVGLAVLLLGGTAILLRVRMSPLLILLPLVGGQIAWQFMYPVFRSTAALQVGDVAFCATALAYIAGHYRLLALWSHILPADPRQRYRKDAGAIVPLGRVGRIVSQHRPAATLSRAEIAWFVLQLPLFALIAQGVWMVLAPNRQPLGLDARWVRIIEFAWGLAVVLFVAGQLLSVIRLLQMDRATARMLLQDVVWHETRREQRRIGRWLAWWRL